jgi:hypothetical protein
MNRGSDRRGLKRQWDEISVFYQYIYATTHYYNMSVKFYIVREHIWFTSEGRELPSNQTRYNSAIKI